MNRNLFIIPMLFMLFLACKKDDKNNKTIPEYSGSRYTIDTSWRTNNGLDTAIKERALQYQKDFPDIVVGFKESVFDGKQAELGITDTINSAFMTFKAYYRKKFLDDIAAGFRREVFKDSLARHSFESIVVVVTKGDKQEIFRYTERSFTETVPFFLHERFKACTEKHKFLDYDVNFSGNSNMMVPGVRFKLPGSKPMPTHDRDTLAGKVIEQIFYDGHHGFAGITLDFYSESFSYNL